MENLFLKLVNVSITACWVVLAVLLLRFLLRKSPKWIHCLLWGIVALRLLIPIPFESRISLIPKAEPIRTTMVQTLPSEMESQPQEENIIPNESEPPKAPTVNVWHIAVLVWGCGVALVLAYGGVSLLLVRRRVGPSKQIQDNVYCCDHIESPFILGVFLPRIYIPSGLEEEQIHYILKHEQAHLKRKDHWWKPLAFCLLAAHWFNPALWLSYILLCQDIEKACDEKAVKDMNDEDKVGYSRTLLECSVQRRMVLACPVAFGEVSVKSRIKSVLSYKKPALWLIIVAIIACTITAVCFLTDPPCEHTYEEKITQPATCIQRGVRTHTCTLCDDSYTESISLLPHTYGEGVVMQSATCVAEGEEEYTCADCGTVESRPVEIIPHRFVEGQILQQPNCVDAGLQKVACQDCGAQEEQPVGVNDAHAYENKVVREATCADPGEGIDTCTRCGHTQTVTYELKKHTYEAVETVSASCRFEGTQKMECTVCGKVYWKTLPKTNEHKWMDMGYYWPDQCMLCGATKSGTDNVPDYNFATKNTGTSVAGLPTYPEPIVWDVAAVNRPK